MISFDIFSLFTVAPLDYTIDLTLKQIYGDKEIKTKTGRTNVKNLLLLFTKNVQFTFGNNIYQPKDNVAMGFLGSVLTDIFIVYLERTLMSELEQL